MSDERTSRSRSRDRAQQHETSQQQASEVYNCYITNLAYTTTEGTLRDLFADCGPVHEVSLVLDPVTKKVRGFGFVSFTDNDSFERALAKTGTDVGGRAIKVERAKRTRAWEPTPGRYLGPPEMSAKARADRDGGRGGGRGDYDDRGGRGGRADSRDRDRGYARGGGYDDRGRGGYDDRGRGGGYDDRDRNYYRDEAPRGGGAPYRDEPRGGGGYRDEPRYGGGGGGGGRPDSRERDRYPPRDDRGRY